MAKRKQPAALARYQAQSRYAPRAPAPIVIRQTRTVTKKKHRTRGRSHTGGSMKVLMGLAIGGFVLGFIDKQGTAIPTIPVLGKAGTIAVAAHFLGHGAPGMVTDVRNAAAVVAAYELGSKGQVSGEETTGGTL